MRPGVDPSLCDHRTLLAIHLLLLLILLPQKIGGMTAGPNPWENLFVTCLSGSEFARPAGFETTRRDPLTLRLEGFEQTRRGTWYHCLRCRRCELTGRVVLRACWGNRNAVCGQCWKPGFQYNSALLACVPTPSGPVTGLTELINDVMYSKSILQKKWFPPALGLVAVTFVVLTAFSIHMRNRLNHQQHTV